jgi:phage replication-related protein YjqB (UPF0714/DUF867 family)
MAMDGAWMTTTGGSDRHRIGHLARELADPAHPAWLALDETDRVAGQDTLRILGRFPTP